MINLKDKQDCCGCSACVQICPRQCIIMQEDHEGFLYPLIKTNLCINCGLCEKVCPVINQGKSRKPLEVYAALNPNNKIRMQSSSGGIFSILAEKIINDGGVVFGARWNSQWEVVHDFTESIEGLSAFRSSKYLQSKIGNNYKQVEFFLKQGRVVLFSGTPCQIAGLKKFLRREYDNLLSIEVFCHSVPSPMVWQIYLNELLQRINWKKEDIITINFRDKRKSWEKYHFVMQNKNSQIYDEIASKNPFMCGFLKDFYTRPSCHACPAKALKSGSDITIGDYWGIQNVMPDYDDDKGVSAVLLNSEKGVQAFCSLSTDIRESDFAMVVRYNPALVHNPICSKKRAVFFKNYKTDLFGVIQRLSQTPFKVLVICKIKSLIGKILDKKSHQYIKILIKK